ncbi:MAG: DUF2723 domain-containing protein, partial [candidate division Zixibacteria bacterium]|nr:DUF2723 domain-containing protein [candidate division Zixibacteria bacterium]
DTILAERIMLLIVFVAFLGIGVHMTTFLILPVAALFFIIKKKSNNTTWYMMTIFFVVELYLVFILSSRSGEIPWYLPSVVVFVVYLFYVFSFDRVPSLFLYIGAGFLVVIAPVYPLLLDSVQIASGPDVLSNMLATVGKTAMAALILFGIYCIYRYYSGGTKPGQSNRYLIGASFIFAAVAGTVVLYVPKGYTAFLVLSAITLTTLVISRRRYIHWPVVIAIAGVSLIMIDLTLFAYGLLAGAAIILALGFVARIPGWKSALMILVMAAAGFSVHLFVPIRSSQQPVLNENNPSESLQATINFLERKQYGSQSMIERMFERRGEWVNQFGNYRRMGFWSFFSNQYGLSGPRFILTFLFAVFGIWELVRRRPVVGLPFVILLLITTIGLVLYMNFADGTRQDPRTGADHIEVRDRDYFFTPGFIYFGLAVGFGTAIAIKYIRDAVGKFSLIPRKIILSSCLIVLMLPSFALGVNYYYCDRSHNYIPYDYAWNILISADKNAVLFTNGDNDTFPLWCLQEVYGVRKDVKVVNLSLANLSWYIKQMQNNMGVNLDWSDEHIDGLRPFHVPDSATISARGQVVGRFVYGYLDAGNDELDSLYGLYGVPYDATFRINSQVVDRIIYHNPEKLPVNFSVTSSRKSRQYLGRTLIPRLSLNGMMWRVNEGGAAIRTDMEATIDYFMNSDKFRTRGVNDHTIYKNETSMRLTNNWANGLLLTADSLVGVGDFERAIWMVESAVDRIPHSDNAVTFLARLYSQQGRVEDLNLLIETTEAGDPQQMRILLAKGHRNIGSNTQAEKVLQVLLEDDHTCRSAFDELMRLYYETNDIGDMKTLFQIWLEYNPNDNRIRMMLQELEKEIKSQNSPDGIAP